jgi:hypothetical protein
VADGITLRVRCGLHLGAVERRDGDYYGTAVNRAARIMGAAHGGQVLSRARWRRWWNGASPYARRCATCGAVRLRDLAEPEHVYQLLHPTLRADFPALRSLEATPNNLPHLCPRSSAASARSAEVKTLLQGVRLVTILGMGGLGKTRLSLQVAADVMDDYATASGSSISRRLSDPQLVPQAVAPTPAVKEEPGHPVQEALVTHVRDRQLLLVFDNTEHWCARARSWQQLLHRAAASGFSPRAASSSHARARRPFRCSRCGARIAGPDRGRRIGAFRRSCVCSSTAPKQRIPHFASPTRTRPRSPKSAAGSMAFRSRSSCGGAHAHAAVEKIAERLADRFRLLTGGDKTAMPRQQTLRALIDWSHDLLSEASARCCAGFRVRRRLDARSGRSGWRGRRDRRIGGARPADALVEKSLVTQDAEGGHYRLLDTVRQYAQEKLAESGRRRRSARAASRVLSRLCRSARSRSGGPLRAKD